MAKVLCKLPNVSGTVSGVKFMPHPDLPGVKVSEEITDAQAADFVSVRGYELVGEKKPTVASTNSANSGGQEMSPDEQAELEALRTRGVAAGLPYADKMGLTRLRKEVPEAEAAAAAEKAKTTQQSGAAAPAVGTGAASGQ